MAHPQNSFRGLFVKKQAHVGADGILFLDYSSSSALIDANSTGMIVAGQLRINNKKYLGANTTGILVSAVAAKPSTRSAGYNWTFMTDTTGRSAFLIRTTGTTWKFANVTSVIPT